MGRYGRTIPSRNTKREVYLQVYLRIAAFK